MRSFSALINTTVSGASTPTFGSRIDLIAGSGVAIMDTDRNGTLDVVIANWDGTSSTLSVLSNTTTAGASTPTFAAPVTTTISTLSGQFTISVGDINSDGIADLLVGDDEFHVAVFRNTTPTAGTPSFVQTTLDTQQNQLGGGASDFSLVDVDGDGAPDVVFSSSFSIATLYNATVAGSATPSFPLRRDIAGGSGYGIAMIDLNRDTLVDAVTSPHQTMIFVAMQR